MTADEPVGRVKTSDAHLEYKRLFRKLDEAIETFGIGSPEADAIRDAMDAPWLAMTEAERDMVRKAFVISVAAAGPGNAE